MKSLLPLTLVSVMLVACGGESSNSSDSNKSDTTVSTVDKKPANACEVLEEGIKASFSDATEMEQAKDFLAGSLAADYLPKDCGYRFTTEGASFDVHITLFKVHSKYATNEAFMKKVSQLNAAETEEVEGMGEIAFKDKISNRFVAIKNKSIIRTIARCVSDPQCSEGTPIAKALANSVFDVLDK